MRAAALLILSAILVPGVPAANSGDLRVERTDFVKTVTLTGDLQSASDFTVRSPRIPNFSQSVIAYLAPEGDSVRAGDLLVHYDPTELATKRLELEQQLEDARTKVAQKASELEAKRQDLLLALATAEKSVEVARLYIGIEPKLIPRAEGEKYRFDFEKAQLEYDKARQRLETLQLSREAEMEGCGALKSSSLHPKARKSARETSWWLTIRRSWPSGWTMRRLTWKRCVKKLKNSVPPKS